MSLTKRFLIAAALALLPGVALGQAKPVANDQGITVLTGLGFGGLHQPATPVDADHPLPVTMPAGTALPVDPVVRTTAIDRGAIVGTTAVTLMPANASRRGFAIEVQSSSADCYISGQGTATANYHSLRIVAGSYYETPSTHVGVSPVSIICTGAATPVYAREW